MNQKNITFNQYVLMDDVNPAQIIISHVQQINLHQ
jgi:hypothetical protein